MDLHVLYANSERSFLGLFDGQVLWEFRAFLLAGDLAPAVGGAWVGSLVRSNSWFQRLSLFFHRNHTQLGKM